MSMINLNGRLRINVIGYTGYINTLNNIMTFVMIDLHHSWRDWKEMGELMVRRSSSSGAIMWRRFLLVALYSRMHRARDNLTNWRRYQGAKLNAKWQNHCHIIPFFFSTTLLLDTSFSSITISSWETMFFTWARNFIVSENFLYMWKQSSSFGKKRK